MNFTLTVAGFAEKTTANTSIICRKIALDAFTRIVERSPVKTGRFRTNWQCSIGSYPGNRLDSEGKSGGGSIQRAASVANSWDLIKPIYLINNLEYALFLEYGKSKQAPQGMVRITVIEMNNVIGSLSVK